jgi:hypothetical protein
MGCKQDDDNYDDDDDNGDSYDDERHFLVLPPVFLGNLPTCSVEVVSLHTDIMEMLFIIY